jgi:hypothetical protein
VAVHVADVTDCIWIHDMDRNEGRKLWPVWTPDGESVAFTSRQSGVSKVFRGAVDGSGPPVELTSAARPESWSPDGRVLSVYGPGLRFVRMDGNPSPDWQASDDSPRYMSAFFPDGLWVTYVSRPRTRDWGVVSRSSSCPRGCSPTTRLRNASGEKPRPHPPSTTRGRADLVSGRAVGLLLVRTGRCSPGLADPGGGRSRGAGDGGWPRCQGRGVDGRPPCYDFTGSEPASAGVALVVLLCLTPA